LTDEAKHGPSLDAAEYRRLWGLCQESRLAACLRAETAEARVQALEAQLAQLRLLAAEWEARARRSVKRRHARADAAADAHDRCAAELRARARKP